MMPIATITQPMQNTLVAVDVLAPHSEDRNSLKTPQHYLGVHKL